MFINEEGKGIVFSIRKNIQEIKNEVQNKSYKYNVLDMPENFFPGWRITQKQNENM